MSDHRIYGMPFVTVYRAYVAKAERKGRTQAEVDEIIRWITCYSQRALETHLSNETDFRQFFGQAAMNPDRLAITGKVCGVQVETVEEPLMREIRYLDKLIDELARGRPMTKILRLPE